MYGSLIWGQHNRIVSRLQIIQNKAIRYMNFKPRRTSAIPLFKKSGILNLKDYITLQNCLFAHDSINRNLPLPLLDDRITFVQTSGNTRDERLNQLVNFRTNTVLYGTRSIKSRAVRAWNEINIDLHSLKLQNCSRSICKDRVFKYLIDKYDNVINENSWNNSRKGRQTEIPKFTTANHHHGMYRPWHRFYINAYLGKICYIIWSNHRLTDFAALHAALCWGGGRGGLCRIYFFLLYFL